MYAKPKLERFGTFRELTLGNLGGFGDGRDIVSGIDPLPPPTTGSR
jgi:hypothetical protein